MAREEAEKLTKVQKELSHLDSLVNADVAIIRDRIEAASIDFLQAQYVFQTFSFLFVFSFSL
jgi:RAB6-interacting golgin